MADHVNVPGATVGWTADDASQHRTPQQVMDAHFAAVRSGELARITADYAPDAVLMLAGSVAAGREQIGSAFSGLLQSAGAIASLAITSLTVHGGYVLLTYTVDSEHMLIPDGVDTFVIERGRIKLQTAHFGGLSTR
ncbi:nuclear transport factor 2 family protein [Piscinibacter koreensis]|uniref:Nuclear transport factor 2 family protein n=1 Tax=Piscinibacter koreensis TaxID=2742824 RepID=A0A7Y6TWN8_9BURK|nr:nuclear transport factor 2 family protein [Schlegelella koreensis]NUZ06258.1 nuclear transport factor 2 family protein [Schlegelella koreensis]